MTTKEISPYIPDDGDKQHKMKSHAIRMGLPTPLAEILIRILSRLQNDGTNEGTAWSNKTYLRYQNYLAGIGKTKLLEISKFDSGLKPSRNRYRGTMTKSNHNNNLIGAAYVRYSSTMQDDSFSLDAQIRQIKARAKAEDIDIVNIYSDPATSAYKNKHRPGITEMLKDSEKGVFNVLYIHKVDRLARRCLFL